jgi:hypothetical protein
VCGRLWRAASGGARAQIHGDVRMIKSVLYASELSLRFPRVNAVRDKRHFDIDHCGTLRDWVTKKEIAEGALPLCPQSAKVLSAALTARASLRLAHVLA